MAIPELMQKVELKFPLAGLDFMLDKNGELYFLEANSVPAGAGVVHSISKFLKERHPSISSSCLDPNILILNHLFIAVKKLLNHNNGGGGNPRNVLVVVPKNKLSPILEYDRDIIIEFLKRKGIDVNVAKMCELKLKNGEVHYRGKTFSFKPGLIYRRVFKFWKHVKQPVVNPSSIGKITQNKFEVHKIIDRYLSKSIYFRQPKYFVAQNQQDAILKIKEIVEYYETAVLKPISGYGGKGIIFVNRGDNIDKMAAQLKYPILIQEKINSETFESTDGKRYIFDIRAFVIGGKFAGFQLRRSPTPIYSNKTSKYITNICSGGAYVHPFICEGENFFSMKTGRKNMNFVDETFVLDGNIAVFSPKFYSRLANASEQIVRAISRAAEESQRGVLFEQEI
ncbi:MAG: hypothetical protein ACP6IP_03900 [Candidatus Njordarchaeia archaeon]